MDTKLESPEIQDECMHLVLRNENALEISMNTLRGEKCAYGPPRTQDARWEKINGQRQRYHRGVSALHWSWF